MRICMINRAANYKGRARDRLNAFFATGFAGPNSGKSALCANLNPGRILSYVCENTAGTETRLKEYEIATEVLRRATLL